MNIFITSIIDLEKTPHSRLHQIIKYLVKDHEVTVLSINDWWKKKQIKTDIYNEEFRTYQKKIHIRKFTNKKISPIRQELISRKLLPSILRNINYKEFDIHFNYNALFSGYYIAKKMNAIKVNTIYDIADNLPEMIRNSPQISYFFGRMGGYLGKTMVKKNIKIARKVTYITQPLKNRNFIPDEKAVWIPNGVDIDLFKKIDTNDFRKKIGTQNFFVLGYLGALREWVDFRPVFEAVKSLKDEYFDIRILIFGEEEGLQEIKNLVKFYNIQNEVIFKGAVSYTQVPQCINSMDVCLIPFRKGRIAEDSMPLKLFEYMACEKPVISMNLEGIKDAVDGRVLYASNKEDYMKQIRKLYDDPTLKEKLGKDGRKYVEKNYSWSKILSKFENVLEGVK